jgi:hypothetical protein
MLDVFTHVSLRDIAMSPGDLSMCSYCGEGLKLSGDTMTLVKLDEEELFVARINPEFRKVEETIRQILHLNPEMRRPKIK